MQSELQALSAARTSRSRRFISQELKTSDTFEHSYDGVSKHKRRSKHSTKMADNIPTRTSDGGRRDGSLCFGSEISANRQDRKSSFGLSVESTEGVSVPTTAADRKIGRCTPVG